MRRRTIVSVTATVVLVALGCQPAADDTQHADALNDAGNGSLPRPNIVLIVADDFGAPYHGFMGNTDVLTPALDELAASGIVFENGYAPANHCRPSLRSMVTGLLPIQYDALETSNRNAFIQGDEFRAMSVKQQGDWVTQYQFHSMRDITTLPKILNELGYLTWQGGKWWEFNYQNGHFTHGMTTGWKPEDTKQEDWFLQLMGGDGRELARVSNQAAYDFVDMAGEQPFFLWYAPELPHYPFEPPDEYYDLYKDQDMSKSAKLYYANCSLFDGRLGELVDFLKDRGKFDNTLFVYVNDNGWEQAPQQEFVGDVMRYNNGGDKGKLSAYDLSFRTPVLFTWPGQIEPNQRSGALIHAADIPATILDYLGAELPADRFGRSYTGVIAGDTNELRSEVVGRVNQVRWEGDMMGRKMNGYWVRFDNWFMSWDLDTGDIQLFDVVADPEENNNVASQNGDVVAALKSKIEAWRALYES